ncbi:MAG: GTP-binding protein [Phycisphaerae bacterium]|nr:GTP-binding protein [Phycisphaerae bacterium]
MTEPSAEFGGDPDCFALLATPRGSGALAIIDLLGDVRAGLARLYPEAPPARGRLSHRRFGDFDDGIVAVLSDERAQLCPHGGPRVIERMRQWLAASNIIWLENADDLDPLELFPEAGDRVEAFALRALTRASSRLAVQLLLAQSAAWQEAQPTADDMPRSLRLRRLLVPPRIVVVGRPNAGKSTLSNSLAGRTISIANQQPGTTRDYVAARIDLEGVVVDWFDTPGLRNTSDATEQEAITLASSVIESADLLIALAEPHGDWPHTQRPPDLRVMNKGDLHNTGALSPAPDFIVSAATRAGLPELVHALRERLVPQADLDSPRPWVFDDRLLAGAASSQPHA